MVKMSLQLSRTVMVNINLLLCLSIFLFPMLAAASCSSKCGEVDIPYPFGVGKDCAMEERFVVDCNNSSILTWQGHEVLKINSSSGEMTINHWISKGCFIGNNTLLNTLQPLNLASSGFTFSTRNKFTVTGCATTAYMSNGVNDNFDSTTPYCSLICPELSKIPNNTCAGVGCCENSISGGLSYFNVTFRTYYGENLLGNPANNRCSYAFLVESDSTFVFNTSFITEEFEVKFPVVIDWSVEKCGKNAVPRDSSTGSGNLCDCQSPGFQGNPYEPNVGCADIDECQSSDISCYGICNNTIGSFYCTCPEGTAGDPKIKDGCTLNPKSSKSTTIIIGLVAGGGSGLLFLVLTISGIFLYKRSKKIMKKKLKQKHFHQNHGLLLEQLLHSHGETTEKTKIFTLKELEKATNNFDKTRIIGDGGHGTVFKGLLLDQRVVAIKRSKVMNETEIKEFINEVSLLSRINHRNVVKLYGCCLESEVPLLVYEFISNGTLSQHLDNWNRDSYLPWNDRVRIATEVAAAIAYLHFASSNLIIHRDLKSANILLDDRLIAKVSDFGASKTVMSEETHITTAVQGTFGYLDPEYYYTGRLTDKSDVYAMGVILVELLTGEKPLSKASHEEGNLTTRFVLALKEDKFVQLLEPAIINEVGMEDLRVVAWLAETCLRLRGEERPTMKQVETTLEGVLKCSRRKNYKQSRTHADYSIKEDAQSSCETSNSVGGYSSGSTTTTMSLNSERQLEPRSSNFLR